jgi:hypothetical protein
MTIIVRPPWFVVLTVSSRTPIAALGSQLSQLTFQFADASTFAGKVGRELVERGAQATPPFCEEVIGARHDESSLPLGDRGS